MLKLQHISRNAIIVKGQDKDILFSYDFPVACKINPTGNYYVDRYYINFTPSTKKHIDSFIETDNYLPVCHESFSALIMGLYDGYLKHEDSLNYMLGEVKK